MMKHSHAGSSFNAQDGARITPTMHAWMYLSPLTVHAASHDIYCLVLHDQLQKH